MFISLLAMFVVALSAGIRATLADVPIVLEGPSTLELGLIGGGILVVYAVTTRVMGRRRARIASANIASPLAMTTEQASAVEPNTQQEPSRGAA